MTAAQIFESISPSIAFITTDATSGSGVLIDGGFIVTNAHVVWPYNAAHVIFDDGAAFDNVPVLNWDHMLDLAVLGPIRSDAPHAAFSSGEDQPIGSEVFLIGYPYQAREAPKPTITRGVLSRLREWESVGVTYFQTDAAIDGGQSGGALVSDAGEIIGVSGSGTERFAFAASTADILPRIQSLTAGEDADGLGERSVPLVGGQSRQRLELSGWWDQQAFVVNPVGTEPALNFYGAEEGLILVLDIYGTVIELEGEEWPYTAAVEYDVPHFIRVRQESEDTNEYLIDSSHPLIPFDDEDDGQHIEIGETIIGNLDYPGDLDYYRINLSARDTVEITADSVLIDPYLTVDFVGGSSEDLVTDDDSGGGIWGVNARISYRAPLSQSYFIIVEGAAWTDVGGYILSVK